MSVERSVEASETQPATVTVYWRPGCLFCVLLRRQLRRRGVATVEHNIAVDPEAAAFVRAHADGNETVPTVDVAGIVVVNPSSAQVTTLALRAGVEMSPTARRRWWRFGSERDRARG